MVRAAATGGAGASLLGGPRRPVERDRRHRTRPAFCQTGTGERKSGGHRSPGRQARTRTLVDRAVPLVDKLARLTRLPVVRGAVNDLVDLMSSLRDGRSQEKS